MAKRRNIKLYALSTCIWCRKTKEFLDKSGVEYEYVYVDELEGVGGGGRRRKRRSWMN
jgi:glutaredoxin-related protein